MSRPSAGTTSGSIAESAVATNTSSTALAASTAYTIQRSSAPCTSSSGVMPAAISRLPTTMVRARDHRSTKTPANNPVSTWGTNAAISAPADASVDPVTSYTV